MILIAEKIPEQGFEVVRDAVGAILKTEIENQKKVQGLELSPEVYIGRCTPFSHSEKIMINVLLDSGNYSNFTESDSENGVRFFVDIYCTAKQTPTNTGGYNSTKIRDRYLGMIKYILQDHRYKTLNLPLGCVMGTYVLGFENFEPSNNQESSFIKMSRLTFSVRINESNPLWDGLEIKSIFTHVKLDLTDLGYKYIIE